MLYDAADDPGSLSPEELRTAYEAELTGVVDEVGVDTVVDESDVDRERIEALLVGDGDVAGELTLEEAASVLAVSDAYPDRDAIVMEVRDHLLMGMTTGVLDVDTIATEVDRDMTGQEVQQALEGRIPMTLDELSELHAFIAGRNDR